MKKIVMILALLFMATSALALPGDPPLSCDPDRDISLSKPDDPVSISDVHKMIKERKGKMFAAKVASYVNTDPQTGQVTVQRRYEPQIDAALKEVQEWEERMKDKVERYMENDPCPDSMGLIIRIKYLNLIW